MGTKEEEDYKDDDSHVRGISRDDNYKNWVKAAEGLVYLQMGLAPFVDREIVIKHYTFKSRLSSFAPGTSRSCCTLENILPDHSRSACIFPKCFCKTNNRTRRKCPNSYCGTLYDLILNEHKTGEPLWKNSDINAWPTDHWSIAKCYMTTPTPSNSAKTTDASGLLSVIINGNFFQAKIASQLGQSGDVFLQARKTRNDIFHRAKMECTDAELQDILDIFIAVLKDPVSLLHDPDAKLAVKNLESLKQSDVVINPKEEQEILKSRIEATNTLKLDQGQSKELDERLQHAEMMMKNVQKLDELVKDLQKDFEDMKTEHKYQFKRMESEHKQSVSELREEIQELRAQQQNLGHESTGITSTIYCRVVAYAEDKKTKEDAESLIFETAREYMAKPKERTYSVSELVNKYESLMKDVETTGTKTADVRKGSVVLEFKCISLDALIDLLDYFCSSRFQARLDDISTALEKVFNKRIHLSGFIVTESLQDVIKKLRHMENEKMLQFEMTCSGVDALLHVLDVFEGNKAAKSLNELSKALSNTLKKPVTLHTSIDIDQMKRAIDSLKEHIDEKLVHVLTEGKQAPLSELPKALFTEYRDDSQMSKGLFWTPEIYHTLSLRLSKILGDIGVNQCVVQRKRKVALLEEKVSLMQEVLIHNDTPLIIYMVGSQIEASTTLGLHSRTDFLYSLKCPEVIQTISDWRQGKNQYLMVQNRFTAAGYCLLQKMRSDRPSPTKMIQDEYHSMDNAGNLFLKTSFGLKPVVEVCKCCVHGPALLLSLKEQEQNIIYALNCQSWPHEAKPWLELNNEDGWPTEGIKRYAKNQGCFLVPVSSKTSALPGLEWRISTSLAERRLMFSLNITQIRCYILMKMIIKDFVKPNVRDVISSYMCKCILFHRIARSKSLDWQDHTLVTRLLDCLQDLSKTIQFEYCPDFIIPENNLLAGKLTAKNKHQLATILTRLTDNIELSLQGISTHNLGTFLNAEPVVYGISELLKIINQREILVSVTMRCVVKSALIFSVIHERSVRHGIAATTDSLKQLLQPMVRFLLNGGGTDQLAYRLLSPLLCSMIASSLASDDIQHSRALSPEITEWFKLGLCSDAASSKLKLASVLYCTGEFSRCEKILTELCTLFKKGTVVCVCHCMHRMSNFTTKQGLSFYEKDELQVLKSYIVFCTAFLLCERNCVPKELQYEMFRKTRKDLRLADIDTNDHWMDSAVVDSQTYLYFLQFKVYQQLCKHTKKLTALKNLMQTVDNDPDIFHKETALNLLGKCMEQETRKDLALKCYVRSLTVKPRNNAAKWHISLLLFLAFKSNQVL